MGMPIRKLSLVAVAGIGVVALLLDKTILSKATGAAGTLTGLVQQVHTAQDIAQTLDSGDPAAIQGLLDTLVREKGADPTSVKAGLFGLGGGLSLSSPPSDTADQSAATTPSTPGGDRVSMIIATAKGGLAVVNGKPMRAGQTINGLTLVEVQPRHVVVEDANGRRTLSLQ